MWIVIVDGIVKIVFVGFIDLLKDGDMDCVDGEIVDNSGGGGGGGVSKGVFVGIIVGVVFGVIVVVGVGLWFFFRRWWN